MKDKKLLALVKRAGRRDEKAFVELCERKGREIVFLCTVQLGNRQDGEDAAQEVLIRMQKNIGGLKSPEAFNVWLNRLILSTCSNMRRGAMKQNTLYFEDAPRDLVDDTLTGLPQGFVEDADMRQRVVRLVNELPEKYRTCILLYYYERMSYNEIAKVLDIKPAAVDNNMRMARKVLKLELENEFGQGAVNWAVMPAVALGPALNEIFCLSAEAAVPPALVQGSLAGAGVYSDLPYLKGGTALAAGAKTALAVALATVCVAGAGAGLWQLSKDTASPPPYAASEVSGYSQGPDAVADLEEGGGEAPPDAGTPAATTVGGHIEIPAEYEDAAGLLASVQLALVDPQGTQLAVTDVAADGSFAFEGITLTQSGSYTLRVLEDPADPLPVPIPDATLDLQAGT